MKIGTCLSFALKKEWLEQGSRSPLLCGQLANTNVRLKQSFQQTRSLQLQEKLEKERLGNTKSGLLIFPLSFAKVASGV